MPTPTPRRALLLLPPAYRPLFTHRPVRRLLAALAACDLGDGMSMVAVAWTALSIAPTGDAGILLGAAVAAYALPGALGALVLAPRLRRVPARRLLAADSCLRAVLLGCVPLAWALGVLRPGVYVALLAGSSLLHAWGGAGKYALLAQALPPRHRLAANALVSTSGSAAVIVGPALAGFLAAAVAPAWIIGLDALSFAFLAVQTGRLGVAVRHGDDHDTPGSATPPHPVPAQVPAQTTAAPADPNPTTPPDPGPAEVPAQNTVAPALPDSAAATVGRPGPAPASALSPAPTTATTPGPEPEPGTGPDTAGRAGSTGAATAPGTAAPAPAATVTEPAGEHRAVGRRLLAGQPELLGILALTWFFNFLYGPVEVALPLHVTDDLHAGARLLGLYWTLFGVGAVLGALGAGALRRLPLWPVTLGIVAGWGVALVPFGLGAPASVTLVCFAAGGLIYGPFTALSFTLFQDRTPAALLTTVLAARGAALLTAAPVGTALGGPLTAALGPRPVLAASGLATLALAATAAVARAVTAARAADTGTDTRTGM
ncbi:hypothetical protein RVR_9390 [Actinacidiphila reveromycinica]|uniref:MFS transporter n=1 Tax=Actinacidiphila reveromycinica TaxID=659352 RepID=A0A7U3V066_9ACTN|nr:MFS transporter [Streptomyces sp. SN-593]BBB01809.1 hypothetical protein RVR_9390 [Streptomyces sp. SN-593]